MKKLLVVTIGFIALLSHTSTVLAQDGRKVPQEQQVVTDVKSVAAPINPYESIGIAHNDGLRTIILGTMSKMPSTKDATTSLVEGLLTNWLNNYATTISLPTDQKDEWLLSAKRSFVMPWRPFPRFPGPYNPFVNSKAYGLAQELSTLPQGISLDTYQARLREIEKRALPMKNDPDFQRVLRGVAIARHSANFWAKEYPTFPGAASYNWGQGACADAVGGFFGALAGALAASAGDWVGQFYTK